MAIGDIALSTSMRQNLVSLQQTADLMSATQLRLATNKKVNSALDNPNSYFIAQANNTRANLLSGLKDNISQAIQLITTTNNGVANIQKMIENLRSQISSLRTAIGTQGTSGVAIRGLASGYAELLKQIDNVRLDATYNGTSLMSGGTLLTLAFNETSTTSLRLSGFNGTLSGLGIFRASTTQGLSGTGKFSGYVTSGVTAGIYKGFSFFYAATGAGMNGKKVMGTIGFSAGTLSGVTGGKRIQNLESSLNYALSQLQTQSSRLSINLSILTTRQSFITDMVNTLVTGATQLTQADTNEEGANMLALQTRQSLGTTSLSLAAQSLQSVLRLF